MINFGRKKENQSPDRFFIRLIVAAAESKSETDKVKETRKIWKPLTLVCTILSSIEFHYILVIITVIMLHHTDIVLLLLSLLFYILNTRQLNDEEKENPNGCEAYIPFIENKIKRGKYDKCESIHI